MIGHIISKLRKTKDVSKTELAREIRIDVGHLTHIEKEERNPSLKTLKCICSSLDIPYFPLMSTYGKEMDDDGILYNAYEHVKCDAVPIFSSVEGFAKCPKEFFNASFVIKYNDLSMAPRIKPTDYVYVEYNAPLDSKSIGVFEYQGKIIIRKFVIRKTDLVLRADDKSIEDIVITKDDEFYVLGKVLGIADEKMSKFVVF